MRMRSLGFFLWLVPVSAIASPPPPPPPEVPPIAARLIADLNPQTFGDYADLFADDLKVLVDGREVASNKQSWLEMERRHLATVQRIVIGHSEGRREILVVDMYDDRSDVRPGMLADPRFITRAARYQLGPDHLIHEVQFLDSGSFYIPDASWRH